MSDLDDLRESVRKRSARERWGVMYIPMDIARLAAMLVVGVLLFGAVGLVIAVIAAGLESIFGLDFQWGGLIGLGFVLLLAYAFFERRP